MAATLAIPSAGPLRAPRFPKILEAELPGGVHGLFARRPALPIVELRLVVPLASVDIVRPAPVSVLSRALLAGTDRHDRISLAEEIEGLGASLGADLHDDRLVISGAVLAGKLGAFVGLLGEVLSGATYEEHEVKADRDRLADETVIALSQPGVIAGQALRRRLFGSHPYATPLPSPATLRRVHGDALRSLHRAVLDPAQAHLAIAGDLQPARALALCEEMAASWAASTEGARPQPPPVSPPVAGPIELVARPGGVQSNLRLGGAAPSLSDAAWPAADLAESIFAGMFSSRLTANLRERNGYSYSPGSYVRHRRAGSYLVVAADVATEATGAALVETNYELGRMAVTGVSDNELEQARSYLVGRFGYETSSLASYTSTLAGLAVSGVGLGYLESYPKGLIAATKAQVDDAARRFLAPSQMVSVVVGDPDRVAGPLSTLGEVVTRSS